MVTGIAPHSKFKLQYTFNMFGLKISFFVSCATISAIISLGDAKALWERDTYHIPTGKTPYCVIKGKHRHFFYEFAPSWFI